MALNTTINVGIRRNIPALASNRNFENSGTVQYQCAHQGLNFRGTAYNVGDALPFDVGGTSYSAAAIQELENYWNQGWIDPVA